MFRNQNTDFEISKIKKIIIKQKRINKSTKKLSDS